MFKPLTIKELQDLRVKYKDDPEVILIISTALHVMGKRLIGKEADKFARTVNRRDGAEEAAATGPGG